MYKVLLCWRYLLTRYLALACIVSVMLGVATLIVVNSVMSGFSTKLRDRMHGMLSDVVVEAGTLRGMDDPEGKMQRISNDPYLNAQIVVMAPTMEVPGMVEYHCNGQAVMHPVHIFGIDIARRAALGGFPEFLLDEEKQKNPSFALTGAGAKRYEEIRQWEAIRLRMEQQLQERALQEEDALEGKKQKPPVDPTPSIPFVPQGMIVGNAVVSFPDRTVPPGAPKKDIYLLNRGEDIQLYTISGQALAGVHARFVVADYIKTGMNEYDSNFVYVPLDYLQKLRTMDDRVTSIQIKLRNYDEAPKVVEALQQMFPEDAPEAYSVKTWEEKQGSLLAAISVERGLLNVLLFMIIAVAGFGILAIFSMIVVEKTRDIGILKALGASNGGVMKIFLSYGLLLGVVGAVLGTAFGLTFTYYLNEIEHFITKATGQEIFPRGIYYFDRIPTNIQMSSLMWVNVGAVCIAVLFSVLPALRAAMLHPVRALRYE
jgi:lipoprotein-releasing system permease protein